MSLTAQQLGDVTICQCSGRITAEDRDTLRRALQAQSAIRMAVLDLAAVSAIDAAGLGMLVSARAWANKNGIELKLMNLSPRVEEMLQLTHLRSALAVCSVSEMIDLLCRASRSAEYQARSALAGG